jgi:NtrC-family two-component system sensor histidine kinase KinB
MRRQHRYRLAIIASLIVLVLLGWLTILTPPDPAHWIPGLFFMALIAFTTTFGVPLGGGSVSLLPMTTVSAYLVMGPTGTAWAAFVGAVLHMGIRQYWAEQLGARREQSILACAGISAANATMQSVSILAGGIAFRWVGGITPLTLANFGLLPVVVLGLIYLSVNFLTAGIYISGLGRAPLRHYLHSLPNLIAYEASPLVFAPLMALIYTQMGLGQFTLFALVLIIASLIARNLALAQRRLERRVKELDSLQAVGQALSASLEQDAILSAVYIQVSQLMPARNFYVALYDPETDEVSFPLAVEDKQRVHWRSRRTGNGLTEYVLQTRAPLLMRGDINATLRELGLAQIGKPAASWLGVPILAGPDPLGVIAVQSYSAPNVYDVSHQEVLITIAAQAAVALQNARLYALTDEALARRVEELISILRTTHEGILLLDTDWRIVAANRALADFLGMAQVELAGQIQDSPLRGEGEALINLIGYTAAELETDCLALEQGEETLRQTIVVPGPPERHVERTLTPVRSFEQAITGWLLVFRDVTEEIELARLRDDMTHMLVHDLRSPMSVVKGSTELIRFSLGQEKRAKVERLLEMTEDASDRILRLINGLLDVSKLESGQMPVHPETVSVRALLNEAVTRLAPLAEEARISLRTLVDPDLPPLHVDAELIGRTLNNLIDNAIKFTPDDGHVRIWARLDADQQPPTMLVGVSDTGPGIPPEAQARLFKKFQQVISNEGRRPGTGLGLPFCKLAVEAHGGEIWVESEAGKGSDFLMRLPVVDGQTAVSLQSDPIS